MLNADGEIDKDEWQTHHGTKEGFSEADLDGDQLSQCGVVTNCLSAVVYVVQCTGVVHWCGARQCV